MKGGGGGGGGRTGAGGGGGDHRHHRPTNRTGPPIQVWGEGSVARRKRKGSLLTVIDNHTDLKKIKTQFLGSETLMGEPKVRIFGFLMGELLGRGGAMLHLQH